MRRDTLFSAKVKTGNSGGNLRLLRLDASHLENRLLYDVSAFFRYQIIQFPQACTYDSHLFSSSNC